MNRDLGEEKAEAEKNEFQEFQENEPMKPERRAFCLKTGSFSGGPAWSG